MADEMDHGRYKFLISPTARSNVGLTIFDPLSASGSFPELTLACGAHHGVEGQCVESINC